MIYQNGKTVLIVFYSWSNKDLIGTSFLKIAMLDYGFSSMAFIMDLWELFIPQTHPVTSATPKNASEVNYI